MAPRTVTQRTLQRLGENILFVVRRKRTPLHQPISTGFPPPWIPPLLWRDLDLFRILLVPPLVMEQSETRGETQGYGLIALRVKSAGPRENRKPLVSLGDRLFFEMVNTYLRELVSRFSYMGLLSLGKHYTEITF